jgi:protoporphyrinogen/coproporphyrinogen III oxidase
MVCVCGLHSLCLDRDTDDESIHDFVKRRLGNQAANVLVPGIVAGIHAGNTEHLSIRSCFPSMYESEKTYGSLVLASLAALFKRTKRETVSSASLSWLDTAAAQQALAVGTYSFRGGLQTLPDTLSSILQRCSNTTLMHNAPITSISTASNRTGTHVVLENGQHLTFDRVFSALPANKVGVLVRGKGESLLNEELSNIRFAPIAVVNLVFESTEQLVSRIPRSFGYLVPPCEKQQILGVAFDSCAFPSNTSIGLTSMTVMLGGDPSLNLEQQASIDLAAHTSDSVAAVALRAIREHLHIYDEPLVCDASLYRTAIPQYTVLRVGLL